MLFLGEYPYCCTICGRKFVSNTKLIYHSRKHTGERPYLCQTCGRSFGYVSSLHKHQKTHTGQSRVKAFACSICDRRVASSKSLKRHMELHSELRPNDCPVCHYTFDTKMSLSMHMQKMSHNSKEYHCDLCDKTFNSNNSMRQHLKMHRRPFPCMFCTEGFLLKKCLDIHILTHADGKNSIYFISLTNMYRNIYNSILQIFVIVGDKMTNDAYLIKLFLKYIMDLGFLFIKERLSYKFQQYSHNYLR